VKCQGVKAVPKCHVWMALICKDYQEFDGQEVLAGGQVSADEGLVHRLLNPLGFVAFKMGRLRGGPSRTGLRQLLAMSAAASAKTWPTA